MGGLLKWVLANAKIRSILFSMKISLVVPNIDLKDEVWAFRTEMLSESDQIFGAGSLELCATYEDWLQKCNSDRTKPTKGRVRASQYIGVDESGKVVGAIQLRHKLNEYLENFGGHIGYSVRPSERRKGYATKMLRQCLELAYKDGIPKVLVTCDITNPASEGVIRKLGGVYEDTRTDPSGASKKRFWIRTS